MHSPPAAFCRVLSYSFFEPFHEEMNQEHQEYFGSKSQSTENGSQNCECLISAPALTSHQRAPGSGLSPLLRLQPEESTTRPRN